MFRGDIIRVHHLHFVEGITLCEDEAFTDNYCRYVENISVYTKPLYHYCASLSGLTGRKNDEKKFFRFIEHISMILPNYRLSQLVAYEEQRMFSLSTQCFQLVRGYVRTIANS